MTTDPKPHSPTPRPWVASGARGVSPARVETAEGSLIAACSRLVRSFDGEVEMPFEENALHIVRCVNAYDRLSPAMAALAAARRDLVNCREFNRQSSYSSIDGLNAEDAARETLERATQDLLVAWGAE